MLNYFILFSIYLSCSYAISKTHYLQQGEIHVYNPSQYDIDNDLEIYCYAGKPKYIIHIWQTVLMEIDHKTNNYLHYDGSSPKEVEKKHEEDLSSWSFSLFSWKQKQFKLNPFNHSCIGIKTNKPYRIFLHIIRVDYWKVLLLITGIFLFLSAKSLCKNMLFYYICGVSFGICASLLILTYLISKMFPGRRLMYGVAICSWTVGVYIFQLLWDNIRVIILNYQVYLIWYICIMGIISFIVCYRLGPVTNQRTINLIRWTLQLVGLVAIFFSSHFQEAAMGQIVMLLICYNIPKSWLAKSKTYWKRKFPPKVNLLTNDEYYEEGVRETSKALTELRRYCSSPNCNQWKTVLKLKNVKRFASFVEGDSHITDSEILDYESSFRQSDVTDDDDVLTEEEY